TAIDDARRVRGNAFRHVGVGRNFGNEGRYLAVFCTADANALLEAGVDLAVRIARLMVGRIEIVVPIDIQPARATELFPFLEEFSVLIKDLYAIVDPISDEQSACRIHSQLMW